MDGVGRRESKREGGRREGRSLEKRKNEDIEYKLRLKREREGEKDRKRGDKKDKKG